MTTTTTTTPSPPTDALDEAAVQAFAGQLMGFYAGGLLTYLIDIGHRCDLFSAAAAGPATSEGLAERAGLDERYVREWLGAMATSGIFSYDATTATYALPIEHAVCLSGAGEMNMAPVSQLPTHLGKYVDQVAGAFRDGGGVPYEAYRPEFTDVMDGLNRGIYDGLLIQAFLPLVPGLTEALSAGARVADIACGTGHALVLLASAFPASTFVGYDFDDGAIRRARAETADAGLSNLTFEVRDVATLEVETPFDAVMVFDAIHDQVDPAAVLARIHAALAPGGAFMMVEPGLSSRLEENIGNPMAPIVYSVSTLHCMTVSLAHGGAGLGTAFGQQVARQLLADAGFGEVVSHPAPGDPMNTIFVTHKEGER